MGVIQSIRVTRSGGSLARSGLIERQAQTLHDGSSDCAARQSASSAQQSPYPPEPVSYVDWFTCKVHEDRKTVTADFGNCPTIENADGLFIRRGLWSWAS